MDIKTQIFKASKDMFSSQITNSSLFSFNTFKPYFNINYHTIFSQISLLLFPYRPTLYEEIQVNLYLPLMSLLTLFALKPLSGIFCIEKTSIFISKTILSSFLILIFYKTLFYFNNIEFGIVELLAYTNYRYFLLIFMSNWRSYKVFLNIFLCVNLFYFTTRLFKQKLFYCSNINNLKVVLLISGVTESFSLVLFSLFK
ncbi:hypothetical protein CDIK_0875 [Cucumispora dikerogammari]|nr:hypothetical protein CDIK_0875 [Cucumispora dikerogammari]